MRLESYPVILRLLSALTKKAGAAGLPNSSQAILSHILSQTRTKGFAIMHPKRANIAVRYLASTVFEFSIFERFQH